MHDSKMFGDSEACRDAWIVSTRTTTASPVVPGGYASSGGGRGSGADGTPSARASKLTRTNISPTVPGRSAEESGEFIGRVLGRQRHRRPAPALLAARQSQSWPPSSGGCPPAAGPWPPSRGGCPPAAITWPPSSGPWPPVPPTPEAPLVPPPARPPLLVPPEAVPPPPRPAEVAPPEVAPPFVAAPPAPSGPVDPDVWSLPPQPWTAAPARARERNAVPNVMRRRVI